MSSEYEGTYSQFRCPECGKEYPERRFMLSHHTQAHNERLTGVELVCETCDDSFEVGQWRVDQHPPRYCSNECRRTGEHIECLQCGKEEYRTRSRVERDQRSFCSEDCLNEWQGRNKISFVCKTCENEFQWSPSRVKEHNPKYCSMECRDSDKEWLQRTSLRGNQALADHSQRTDIELIGRKILKSIFIDFSEQHTIGDKFVVDAFVASHDLIIQWDGDYWHCHPKYDEPNEQQLKQKRVDKSQAAYFDACGYKLLRFWGSDIRDSPREVRRQIIEVVE